MKKSFILSVIYFTITQSFGYKISIFSLTNEHKTTRSRCSVSDLCNRFNLQDDIFSPKVNHPTSFDHDPPFAYKPLNDPATRTELLIGSLSRLSSVHVKFFEQQMRHDRSEISPARLAHALALRECVDAKELFESLEFYLRVRRRVRRPVVVDLACGHGLCGMLFAALERDVVGVALVDARRPNSFDAILAAVTTVAPWAAAKVHFLEQNLYGTTPPACRPRGRPTPTAGAHSQPLTSDDTWLPMDGGRGPTSDPPTKASADGLELPAALRGRECGFVAVHACGRATDRCLAIAAAAGGPVAAMPCCYTGCGQAAPYGVRRMLGKGAAADVDRAYALERAGYAVDFAAIPRTVTPMNRILVAVPRAASVSGGDPG
jgi:hypothetical protein